MVRTKQESGRNRRLPAVAVSETKENSVKSSKALAWMMAAVLACGTMAFGKSAVGRPAHQVDSPVVFDDVVIPFGVGVVNPMQFPDELEDVVLMRLSLLWNVNQNVHYVDLGLVGTVTLGDFGGIQAAGIWNEVMGDAAGVQVAGLFNYVGSDFSGVQFAAVNYMNGGGCFRGLELGGANLVGEGAGVQFGLVNSATDFCGLQAGLFNAARHLQGVQIGLINFIADSPLMIFPLVNASF